MTLVLSILLALGCLALSVQVMGQLAVFVLVGRRLPDVAPWQEGVTILKPLKGVDPQLEANLRSIFEQDYERLEVVFGANDPHDPALALARSLAAQYQGLPCQFVSLPPRLGHNPKVNLCAELAKHASHDLLIISDSSVRAPRDYVRAMLGSFGLPGTGLVSSPLLGIGETAAGGAVDNLMLNLLVLRGVCLTKLFFRHSCVVGKSIMFRRSMLQKLGGWGKVANVLAEDYVLGQLFRQAGFEVRLCPQRLPTTTHCSTLKHSVERHLRWCQMRRRTSLTAYAAEFVSNVSVWGLALVAGALLEAAPSLFALGAGLLLLGAKLGLDLVSLLWLAPRKASLGLLLWVPTADLINLWVWLLGSVKRSVEWRGTRLLIGRQTRLTAFVERPVRGAAATYSTAHL